MFSPARFHAALADHRDRSEAVLQAAVVGAGGRSEVTAGQLFRCLVVYDENGPSECIFLGPNYLPGEDFPRWAARQHAAMSRRP